MRLSLKEHISLALALAGILAGVFSLGPTSSSLDTDIQVRRMEHRLSREVGQMDSLLVGAFEKMPRSKDVPSGMVIYRYRSDTLQSWCHQFPISNDNISYRAVLPRMNNPRVELVSPLAGLGEELEFRSLGPENYLLRSINRGEMTLIGGLRVTKPSEGTIRGEAWSIQPLSESGGQAVEIDGRPLFKLQDQGISESLVSRVPVLWISVLLLIASLLVVLSQRKTKKCGFAVTVGVTVLLAAFYYWGRTMQGSATLFSPTLYADGSLLYSIGAVIIINLWLSASAIIVFLSAESVGRRVSAGVLAVAICAYGLFAIRSIILNSAIELELYNLSRLDWFSALVIISFLLLLSFIPLLLHVEAPLIGKLFHKRINPLSLRSRVIFSTVSAIVLVAFTALFGFRKESCRMEMWGSRLAMDRDIGLELQLRSVEGNIAVDPFLGSLAVLGNTNTILNRLTETYFLRLAQSYDISVALMDGGNAAGGMAEFFRARMSEGTPIAEGSRFLVSETPRGLARYRAVFSYFDEKYGASHMLLEIEPKTFREDYGLSSILDISSPGKVSLPPDFSYARYRGGLLIASEGNFSYPTKADFHKPQYFVEDGRAHFKTSISEDEDVVISRPVVSIAVYCLAAVFVAMICFLLSSIPVLGRRHHSLFKRNYYRTRVTMILTVSLVVTLLTMAAVSVVFVARRNQEELKEVMYDKLGSLQTLLEGSCNRVGDFRELNTPEFKSTLEQAGEMSKLDISLYSPSGTVFITTAPELFERRLVPGRMDSDAYDNIMRLNRSYFIHRERIGKVRFYAMYAPLINSDATTVAIVGCQYLPKSYDFGRAAILHSATVIMVFLLLLILGRFMSAAIVDRMFKPLQKIGRRMGATNVDNLEYITYDSDDEISSLVEAYNRMVRDLSESTRQLAQAERDKAWSGMARQVAHEIKNPLTPMKLQLQRIMRLKAKGDSQWQEKFDDMANVMLYHIDVLSDTANQFSTFAKLYTEEHVAIDLDALLQEEVSMFDNKEGVNFTYMGLEGVCVMGPKPQLTRVFVNLIANSVQAIEIMQAQQKEEGLEVAQGQIVVSLRRGTAEGSYDIVFEDNGPGVSDENQAKLFTPNFTTKSGGTGLGLAISRSILEKCRATISYTRSFSLGGACFIISYPGGGQ